MDFEGPALALTDPRLRHLTLDQRHLPRQQGPDRARVGAILVTQGQMKEQVLDRQQVQPGETLGKARADPAQSGQGDLVQTRRQSGGAEKASTPESRVSGPPRRARMAWAN